MGPPGHLFTPKEQTMTPLWQNLKQLVALDQKQKTILSQIAQIEQEAAEDNLMIPELQATINEIKQAVIDAKKNVDRQELNANNLKAQETSKKKALDTIKNQKQYEALEKELSSILRQISELDDTIVKAWHTLDLARKKEETELSGLSKKIEALQTDAEEKEKSINSLKQEYQTLEQQKEEFSSKIPPEWLSKYERMKDKVSDPIVPAINDSCSSCYYSVPSQDMTRLKRNAILPCRSCYRLLYHDQEEEKDLKEASF